MQRSRRHLAPRPLIICTLVAVLVGARAAAAQPEWKPEAYQAPGVRFWREGDLEEVVASKHLHSWRPLVDKLLSGRGVTLLTIGSSIVENSHGVFFSSRGALDALGVRALPPSVDLCPLEARQGGAACVLDGTVAQLMAYINKTWPHPEHALINAGHSGSDLRTLASAGCYDAFLPASADLLIFENHIDDALCQDCPPRIVEGVADAEKLYDQLAHRVQHGDAPLPLVMLSYVWVTDPADHELSWSVGLLRRNKCNANFTHRVRASMTGVAAEDRLSAAAAYYGWTMLSMRNMLWASLRDGAHVRLNLSECEFISALFEDQIHPSRAGARLMGDALIMLLQQAVARFGSANATARADAFTLPTEPLVPGSWSERSPMCTEAKDLTIIISDGWEFVAFEDVLDHASNTMHRVDKPGLLATRAGATVKLLVNTRFMRTNESAPATLRLGFLRSYEHMGAARVECLHHCACAAATLQAHHESPTSVMADASLNVTQARHCTLQLTVVDATESGEHKFKLLTLLVLMTQ